MRVPLSWLEEFVCLEDLDAERIAEELSLRSVEAEVHTFGIELERVFIGKVLEKKSFGENLFLLKVDVGEVVDVVTADPKVEPGDGVIVALAGGRVGETPVKEKNFGDIKSRGVLLSAKDLGLEETSEGVITFRDEAAAGTDAGKVLGFGEKIIELDLTPNRGDLLSIKGLARELSALFGLKKKERKEVSFSEGGGIPVKIEDGDCKRYRGVVIREIRVEESPLWIRKRLWQCGLRPISNVVDVTNYIMLQEGQPLHAFDLSKLDGGIIVRSARVGEKITTLDGEERELSEEVLVIADEMKPVAVAGVMGGLESAVTSDTKDILLEAAYFDPIRVRRSSKELGLKTESSYRFERNTDIEALPIAQDRAVDLILRLAGGFVEGVTDNYREPYKPKKVFLALGKFIRYAGRSYDKERVKEILTALEIPHEVKRCGIEVLVPSHRSFDMGRDVDVIEEIMRVEGYDSFPAQELRLPAYAKGLGDPLTDLRKFLQGKGLAEVVNLSFEDDNLYKLLGLPLPQVEIVNPLVPTQRFMRSSLLPSLLRTAKLNESRYNTDLAIFEIGKVFTPNSERETLGILLKGTRRSYPEKVWDPYDLLDIVQGVVSLLRREVTIEKASLSFLHPHAQAKVVLEDKEIGFLGKLHPEITQSLELKGDVLVAELNLHEILSKKLPTYRALSQYPPVVRDLALVVDKNLSVSKLINEIRSQLGDMLERVSVFDIFAGEKVGEGKKSVGVRLVFRSLQGSLSGEEVNLLVKNLLGRLQESLGVRIR